MNRITIIGNLTRAPELRTTQSGKNVCTFTVAVNRRVGDQAADYFRVSAWSALGENCQKYLDKGSKVAVIGSVSVSTYTANNGENRANLEVIASEVEFLNSKTEGAQTAAKPAAQPANKGYQVITDEDLPF